MIKTLADQWLEGLIGALTPLEEVASLNPLEWAVTNRRIQDGPFTVIPPLEAPYLSQAKEVVVMKAAQVFISEYCINLAFWCADTHQGQRGNVLYVFPSKEHIGDFSRARIDKAIGDSEYLRGRVKGGPLAFGKPTDNVGLKRIGDAYLYFRGSNAEAGLISVDADLVIYDEVDRLREGTLALGAKRLGSSLLGWQRYASTPKYPETGIDALWLNSSKSHYHLKCEHCNEWQFLTFPDNVKEDGEVICRECKGTLDRTARGEWVAENQGAAMEGYHMTKLLSPRANIVTLATLGYRILNRDVTDQSQIQEFYNQDLGVAHAPEGGQLARAELAACMEDYSMDEWTPTHCAMGVDIGAKLHVEIIAPSPSGNGKQRVAFIGTVQTFGDLDSLMNRFDVTTCVVDAMPEGHSARDFEKRFQGRVWLCTYPNIAQWSHNLPVVWKMEEFMVQAHRTLTLDASYARVRERRIEYPRELFAIPEYAEQMMAPIRILEKDAQGNLVAKYTEGGKADHYCFVADTMVKTDRGEIPIQDIRAGMKVLTRSGHCEVQYAGQTMDNATVCRYLFSDRSVLIGTPNHPVYVRGKGFIPLDTLHYGDIMTTWKVSAVSGWKRSYIRGLSFVATQTALGDQIASISRPVAHIVSRALNACIKKFGRICTAPSRQIPIFTMMMETPQIMIPRIWSAFQRASTAPIMPRNCMLVWTNNLSRMQWIASVPYLNSGTNLPRGSSYTEITQPSCGILKSINTFALSAINPLRPFGQALLQETDSALTDAVQLTGALQGLMMKIGHAWFAGQHLGQAAIQRLKRVLVPAKEDSLVWFAESTQANNAPVYNLSVLESQEYFANGILVHNCHARNYAEIALRHGLGDSMGVLEYYRKKAEDNEQKKAQQEPQ